ncbi:hypothetical protein [Ponticoccus alexandrii]|uniref:Uncharacterized protein n=1 Tax=Ponticoccus alexandrii TaxID=1943633 RepID=A0ABX7FHH1_9RHOB|nr:hypothetical protein [Ponticoccus alexandrii]ETA52075.1 hypothetical protein P279_10635 [Rhodobacteraceae bacterium PD-2]QRF69143.1 hypothetical protein GQA70_22620 [Ponticoccus alexandrii]
MLDPADTRFFTALQQVLAETDARTVKECRAAVDKAVASGAPLDLRAAWQSVDALSTETRDRIMAQVHARMASDLSAIWNFLPNAPDTPRSH